MKNQAQQTGLPHGAHRSFSLLCLGLLFVSGCGGSEGPERVELSGTVTYGGAPVPSGQIIFVPDAEKGHDAPAGMASIKQGKFETLPGKGPTSGPHIARINGYDDAQAANPAEGNAPIFPEYRIPVEIRADQLTIDFKVPASKKP